MDYGLIHSVWTVLLVILFIGIVIWAWSSRQRPRFERAARSVLEEEAAVGGDKNHV